MALGEIDHSDASYTGEVVTPFTLQYYRDKATQFQQVLNALDSASYAAESAIGVTDDQSLIDDLSQWLGEYDSKKQAFKLAAEAINGAAAVINSAGGRFPSLSIPNGLGLAPVVLSAAYAAGFAGAAALIVWGNNAISGLNLRLMQAQAAAQQRAAALEISDPAARDIALAQAASLQGAIAQAQSAQDAAEASPLSSVAGIVKWGAIAYGAFLVWRAYEASKYAD